MRKKALVFILHLLLVFTIIGLARFSPCANAQSAPNTITFDNRSGEPALVVLVGPIRWRVEVPDGEGRTVKVGAGRYYPVIRYGNRPDQYRYSKGEPFDVEQTATQYSVITITLHKVIGGNYQTHPTTRQEFEEALAQSEQVPIPVSSGEKPPRFQGLEEAKTIEAAPVKKLEMPKVYELPKIQTFELPKPIELPKVQVHELPKIQTFELPKPIEPAKIQLHEVPKPIELPKLQPHDPPLQIHPGETTQRIPVVEASPKIQKVEQHRGNQEIAKQPGSAESSGVVDRTPHAIAVLSTGFEPEAACNKLASKLPDGFVLVAVQDESAAEQERFWGVLSITHTTRTYETGWMFRRTGEKRELQIRLRPKNKIFNTNWDYLILKGGKEPGPSLSIGDWKTVDEWGLVPILRISLETSEVDTVMAFLKDKGPGIRAAAARRLGELKEGKALVPLIAALKDEHIDVRSCAAEALGELKDSRAVEALLISLRDKEENVQRKTIEALGKIKDPRAVEPLSTVLLTHGDSELREEAAQSLGRLGGKEAVSVLAQALLSDIDSDVRAASAEALGEAMAVEGVRPLCLALVSDKDEEVTKSAANSLIKIGHPSAVPFLQRAVSDGYFKIPRKRVELIAKVLESLRWSPQSPKEAVLFWLAKKEKQKIVELKYEAVPTLVSLLTLKDDWDTIRQVIELLGEIRDPAATEPLMDVFKSDSDWRLRIEAAESLGSIGDKKATPVLADALLNDENEYVRASCASALGRIRGPEVVEPLCKSLSDKEERVVQTALLALGEAGEAKGVSCLCPLLDHDDRLIRTKAVEVLGKLGSKTAVSCLGDALGREKDEHIVKAILTALGELRVPPQELPLRYRLQLLAEKNRYKEIREILDKLPTEKLIETLTYGPQLVVRSAVAILVLREESGPLSSDPKDWIDWWEKKTKQK